MHIQPINTCIYIYICINTLHGEDNTGGVHELDNECFWTKSRNVVIFAFVVVACFAAVVIVGCCTVDIFAFVGVEGCGGSIVVVCIAGGIVVVGGVVVALVLVML